MKLRYYLAFGTGLCLASIGAEAQVLNRLKQKVKQTEQKAGDEIDKLLEAEKIGSVINRVRVALMV
ncbi:MAG: hypothetical protein IPJ20_15125 [Flammeovirgaceae bacterium]|nr:hypothetical protein [Flammeovirgaceae bacterium]